jgi:hypothetical protein
VAEHAIQIFDRFHNDMSWAAFFADMRSRRDRFLAQANESLETLARDYMFVRAGDLISLTFCNGWTAEQRIRGYRIQLTGAVVAVSPGPFAGETVALRVAAKRLPVGRYVAASARLAYDGAPAEVVAGTAAGAAG